MCTYAHLHLRLPMCEHTYPYTCVLLHTHTHTHVHTHAVWLGLMAVFILSFVLFCCARKKVHQTKHGSTRKRREEAQGVALRAAGHGTDSSAPGALRPCVSVDSPQLRVQPPSVLKYHCA